MVKLLRTDTTLDLSQKARVVRNPNPPSGKIYTPLWCAHGPCLLSEASPNKNTLRSHPREVERSDGRTDRSWNHTATRMKGLEECVLPARMPNPHQGRLWRSHFIPLLAGLGALVWINGYFRGTEPAVHALCSPHGAANIYTVDANNAKAQCLVVKGERFLRTGAYGEYVRSPRPFGSLTRCLR